ncbi:MAG TPA: hypothetical protein VF936_11520 [Burkholderiales bacterium]
MHELELGDQLALARLGVVGDFPVEVRGVGGGADVDDLIVVPQLEDAGRIRRDRDKRRRARATSGS